MRAQRPDLNVRFLGTATSTGIPVIGCSCARCQSANPKLMRLRSSIHLQYGECSLLVDTGPDLRMQALRAGLKKVDAVFYTHAHMDHIVGFDDLRAFCWHRTEKLPLYGSASCLASLQSMFSWAFTPQNTYKGYVQPDAQCCESPMTLQGLTITPIPVVHGLVPTQGYCFELAHGKRFAYLPDVKEIPETSLRLLTDLDVLAIDCLHLREHPTHLHFEQSLAYCSRIGAKQSYLTHISHELDVIKLEDTLPSGVSFAYDGLHFTL